jgi:hypothetical protein
VGFAEVFDDGAIEVCALNPDVLGVVFLDDGLHVSDCMKAWYFFFASG